MGKAVRSVTRPIQRGIGQLNPLNPGSAVGKITQQIPGVKEAQNIGTQIFQPLEKAVVQPVSRGLASLDKAVGNAIPGGWGTIGTIAASMIPGGQFAALGLSKTAAMTGLGALTGSGVLRPGRSFNLQGAVMGGALAYGSSQLADYAAAAGGAEQGTKMATLPTSEVATQGVPLVTEPPMGIMDSISNYAGDVGRNLTSSSDLVREPTMFDKFTNAFSSTGGGPDATFNNLANLTDPGYADVVRPAAMPPAPTLSEQVVDFGKSYAQNVKDVGSGIKNLLTEPGAAKAASAATGINPIGAAGATIYGATGLMALDEQEKYLKEQLAAQQIAQADYDQAVADINRQRDYAQSVVNQSPFNPNPSRDVSIGETFYGRTPNEANLYARTPTTLYAMGGSVDDELGGDYSAMGMDQGNLQKGLFGQGYSMGGTPRFLSGGGDGMSDSIPATINNKQPARLADGEFVIPADVVSHLGNGSSKAGAKQLYSMMDRIRTARTGNKKQGKQVNPRKYMPA